MKNKNKGFTLIELLSVIAILGIIMSIVVPRIGNYNKSAKKATYLSNAKTIISAIELYNVESDELINDSDKIESVKEKLFPKEKDKKKYLNSWPEDFPSGVEKVEDLKKFIENPNETNYYQKTRANEK
ncbi:MAG: type II secretion system GspH family protein [Caloramator sp.]|nr:type II secretion system GspH family protein [Caloramator sp.]